MDDVLYSYCIKLFWFYQEERHLHFGSMDFRRGEPKSVYWSLNVETVRNWKMVSIKYSNNIWTWTYILPLNKLGKPNNNSVQFCKYFTLLQMRMGVFGAKKPRQKFSIALILLYFVVLLLLYIIQIKSVLSHKTRLITLQQLKIQVTSEIKRHILIFVFKPILFNSI